MTQTPAQFQNDADAMNLRTAREYILLDPAQFPALVDYARRVLKRLGTEEEKRECQ